jgi:hypothetical protein
MGIFPRPEYCSDWISGGKLGLEGAIMGFEKEELSAGAELSPMV